jgi:xylulose-5-phosphate/fructose-6-phosphate phosphoketolase
MKVSAKSAGKSAEREQQTISSSGLERYQRAVNYLAAAQVYLRSNALLEEPLRPEHIKSRLLGHWGTCPGINLVYSHLNHLILRTDASILLITGPGHGAAANLANLYLEGTLTEFYPELTHDRAGLERLVRAFSWPDGFPSHLYPGVPGVIHEGGELGYALATAFGAALDNPELIVACIVGDGEAETGPTATSWHGTKFLNPRTDGAVLPILHLNDYKISSPSVFGTMSEEEMESLFRGYGWMVRLVELSEHINEECGSAFSWAFQEIRRIQAEATGQLPERPRWPLLILRTPKGWTGPKEIGGKIIEGSFRSHQVPARDAASNPAHLEALERWLRSYRPQELFSKDGKPADDILGQCPRGKRRLGMNPHSFGGRQRRPLDLPSLDAHKVDVARPGKVRASPMIVLGKYLRELLLKNSEARNFRIVCPDELESNRLGDVFEVTARQYTWPIPQTAEHMAGDGRVLEMLSEHMCQGWLQGYLLTGRHGLFPCYEAFIAIVDGMMNQYAKFLKSSLEIPWRLPISSLNYLLTSEAWRQDHNGYSHQGPGFINNLLTKKGHTYRIYLPPDANCLLATIQECLTATSRINLVIAGKQPMPQWLTIEEAVEHYRIGASIWTWASTYGGEEPDLVLACCGDNLTLETLAAAQILREEVPDWHVRVVNVTDLLMLGIPQKYPEGLDEGRFQRLFPLDCPVIFNFHGYTGAVKQLLWERPQDERFDINGYREEGTTTTPFDMHVRNRTSRYHVVIQAGQKMAARFPRVAARAEGLIRAYEERIREHRRFIRAEGLDPAEIADWQWRA